MLVTTCPDCETTFKLSTEMLGQAKGQVRCGKCSRIFDGHSSLREISDRPAPDGLAGLRSTEAPVNPEAQPRPESRIEPKPPAPATESRAPEWLNDGEPRKRRVWPWAVGTALMALTLCGQFVHHFRAQLAAVPTVGSMITTAYAQVGIEVLPEVDLDQYDLLDLTAAAQPLGEEPGWLIIETRVLNQGPKLQPFPHIFVRLLDRWDATVAGRYFAPGEYTVSTVRNFSRMNPGSTIDAQFIIMDPGPSATGFELEICVPIAHGYLCESHIADD